LWSALWIDFELRAPADGALLAALRAADGIREAQADKLTLSVHVDDEARIPAAIAAVAEGGGQIMRANPREHSLEDIYFELQRRMESAS
jgi:hypothetical protein